MWLKYKKECPSGYQYTQYCHHFKKFIENNYGSEAVSMVVERIPGEKVYIDWIGDQPEILVNSQTGEIKKVHFFVTTVGVSNLMYAEAFEDEKLIPAMEKHDYHVAVKPFDLILGLAGAHSSFTKMFKEVAEEKGVGLYPLILEVSKIDRKNPSRALCEEVADRLAGR